MSSTVKLLSGAQVSYACVAFTCDALKTLAEKHPCALFDLLGKINVPNYEFSHAGSENILQNFALIKQSGEIDVKMREVMLSAIELIPHAPGWAAVINPINGKSLITTPITVGQLRSEARQNPHYCQNCSQSTVPSIQPELLPNPLFQPPELRIGSTGIDPLDL